jgi:radical SAM protein with 4Fe4S-binding SPASM domain
MKRKKYQPIEKTRREHFGGIIFRERPAFVAHVNKTYADAYQIPETKDAIMRDGVFSAPLDAHLAVTTRCNMFCKGCYTTCKGDEPKDITIDKAKAVIDRLSELGVFSLSFGGGEPTLYPGLFEIAEYAREKNILPNMTTNGSTMTEQFAEKCSVFGNVHFSIHTLQDMDHIFRAAHTCRKVTGNKPGLNLLLTTETLPHLDKILYKAKISDIKKVLFLRYKKTAKNMEIQGLRADSELEELPMQLKKLKWKNKRLMFLFDCSLFEILVKHGFSDIKTYRKYDANGCQGGNAYIAIDVNGMYKPCSFWQEPFGSVLDLNFDNWIHNPKLIDFRNKKRDKSCTCCEYKKLCGDGCRLLYDIIR